MKNFLFYDVDTGEEFIVEAKTRIEARKIADCYFDSAVLRGTLSNYEAEMSGLDTY
jgi:hypothetical protein